MAMQNVTGAWWVTGEPTGGHAADLGGGPHYAEHFTSSDADFVVSSDAELASALSGASSGDVVFVASDVTLSRGRDVPGGVTLAGDRGVGGSQGPVVSVPFENEGLALFSNSRVSGIVLDGPQDVLEKWENHGYPAGWGMETQGSGVEVDNCEIRHFSQAGIRASHDTSVHHCDIHHNMLDGVGYGVEVIGGSVTVERCSFTMNRHSLAQSSGDWTVRESWFGPLGYSHVLDYHSPADCVVERTTVETVEARGPGVDTGINEGWIDPETTVLDARDGLNSLSVTGSWFFRDRIVNGPRKGSWLYVAGGLPSDTTLSNNSFGSGVPADNVGHPRGETNTPPAASFDVTSTDGLTVSVDASGSSDPDGDSLSYDWQTSDGQTASGAAASFTFPSGGSYVVTLTVTDDAGATATASKDVSVTEPVDGGGGDGGGPNRAALAAFGLGLGAAAVWVSNRDGR